jgi:hypothetical protein
MVVVYRVEISTHMSGRRTAWLLSSSRRLTWSIVRRRRGNIRGTKRSVIDNSTEITVVVMDFTIDVVYSNSCVCTEMGCCKKVATQIECETNEEEESWRTWWKERPSRVCICYRSGWQMIGDVIFRHVAFPNISSQNVFASLYQLYQLSWRLKNHQMVASVCMLKTVTDCKQTQRDITAIFLLT